ncbi:MAG: ergothioneine biosynthesis protein EgtB [Burkholderiales bacterium]|nr:ergothioneine biosynthesis protein EgtB [Burkholderiales bacterium]
MKPNPRLAPLPAGPLARAFSEVRQATLALASPLSPEDCQVQSMPDASPAKWHLAHITWFFETFILERFEPAFKPFDASFRVLFNSYYQGVGEMHPRAQRGLITRPTLSDVLRYRADVDARVQRLLASQTDNAALSGLVTLGLHHEQQHQELLLTDIKHALSFSPLHKPYAKRWPMTTVRTQPLRWLGFEGGLIEHGFDQSLDGAFSFDNEGPRHHAYTAPFELASRPATYGEYLAFIEDGGYARAELWLSMGWDWVRSGQRSAPLYWHHVDGMWVNHTLQGQVEIDPRTPVCHLSYFEADAFARWAGARLPTEVEWELAARSLRAPQHPNFANRGAYHPLPADDASSNEPLQMFGDVWEWTQSSYSPYPGYRALPGAVGEYNGKFMCNQYVLRGGSCATPAGHVRASYRNFFPPDAQWQFSGVRLAR